MVTTASGIFSAPPCAFIHIHTHIHTHTNAHIHMHMKICSQQQYGLDMGIKPGTSGKLYTHISCSIFAGLNKFKLVSNNRANVTSLGMRD